MNPASGRSEACGAQARGLNLTRRYVSRSESVDHRVGLTPDEAARAGTRERRRDRECPYAGSGLRNGQGHPAVEIEGDPTVRSVLHSPTFTGTKRCMTQMYIVPAVSVTYSALVDRLVASSA